MGCSKTICQSAYGIFPWWDLKVLKNVHVHKCTHAWAMLNLQTDKETPCISKEKWNYLPLLYPVVLTGLPDQLLISFLFLSLSRSWFLQGGKKWVRYLNICPYSALHPGGEHVLNQNSSPHSVSKLPQTKCHISIQTTSDLWAKHSGQSLTSRHTQKTIYL